MASTPQSAEIYAFAPGLDPSTIHVQLERGVLSISGERAADYGGASVHVNERFAGRFHRVMALSDDLDPDQVHAGYRDGVLHISIQRQAAAQPRRIQVSKGDPAHDGQDFRQPRAGRRGARAATPC